MQDSLIRHNGSFAVQFLAMELEALETFDA